RTLQHVARHRPREARRQGLPHRPSGILQRPDARRHARRRRDGHAGRRRSASRRRRARGHAVARARRRDCLGAVNASAIEPALRKAVRGEVRFDAGSRALYATDASNYRQVPIGLVVPRDAEDVVAALAVCREFGAPVLPRGGGTSLAGQCCNVAVVFDFSKYMNGILELDPRRRFARVQPGIVLDTLRARAEQHTLTFAPDPSTHSRCTLGGMIGNNSCGTHSLMAGKTVDNVEQLHVLLYDGTELTVGPTSDAEYAKIVAGGGRRAEIYSTLKAIATK